MTADAVRVTAAHAEAGDPDLRRADRAASRWIGRCRPARRRASARRDAPSACRDRSRRSASTGRARRLRSPRRRAARTTRNSWGEIPLPSITTTTPGHGGGDAGTAVKNGTAMSTMSRARYRTRPADSVLVVQLQACRRRGNATDLGAVVDTISGRVPRAIPVWSWAFPDDDARPRSSAAGGRVSRGECAAAGLHVDGRRRRDRRRCGSAEQPELTDEVGGERAPTCSKSCWATRSRIVLDGLAPSSRRAPARRAALLPELRRDARRPPRARASASSCSQNLELIDAEHLPGLSRVEQPGRTWRATAASASSRVPSSRCPTTARPLRHHVLRCEARSR